MTGLPEGFTERMKALLGEEYEAFENSSRKERTQGLRANLLKAEEEHFQERFSSFGLRKIPWVKEGFYYDETTRPGKSPWHEAGAFYIQEPSAMAVVSLLDPKPGEKVLDLCAAPGGKTSHAASRMKGKGLLVSNEIHPARAKILSQNVERMGMTGTVVTNSDPAGLKPYFPEFFDKIIVDAPCSGEGMFRKEEEAVEQWSLENVLRCAIRQLEILDCAAAMLRPGGRLVYSTCTFAPEEDEGTVETFLEQHPEFSVVRTEPMPGLSQGRPEWVPGGRKELADTFRIWPHKSEGEGHYLALLEKKGDAWNREGKQPVYWKDKNLGKDLEQMLAEVCPGADWLQGRKEWVRVGDQIYLLPGQMPDFDGLRVLRAGLHVASVKKNRLEPAHALAAALKPEEAAEVCRLDPEGEEVKRYLNGETLAREGRNGWILVCVGSYSLGWGKQAGGTVKNHYPKGLRRQL